MAMAYKVLGQSQAATTSAAVYTVPSATSAIVSTIALVNTSANDVTASVYVCVPNPTAVASASNALLYGATIPANSTATLTLGLALQALTEVHAQASASSSLTVQAFGAQIS